MARNWDALSESYRERLERGGITRAEYQAGASVSAARGHAATPERPSRAEANPEKYAAYLFKRDKYVQTILRAKGQAFSSRDTYKAKSSRWHVNNFQNGKTRSIASLKRIVAAIEAHDNLDDAMQDLESDDVDALYYH